MRPNLLQFIIVLLMLVSCGVMYAQTTGDYRSIATGNWNTTAIWQRYNGTAWVAAPSAPTGTGVITVQAADSVNINVPVSITGTLRNQGRLGGTPNLTIPSGGTYQHDQDAGSVPVTTWTSGSTLLMTGSSGGAPDNRNQSFHHVRFNTPNLLANLSMSWTDITIGGNITVENTGSARWYLTTALAGDSASLTIIGDVIVQDGNFSTNGTGNANTRFIIHQQGNINVTGGNLSISRGSQGSGTGSTRWYLHNGNFTMSNATTQNSNATNAWFVFDKAGTQTLRLTSVTFGGGGLPIVVSSGTTLDIGSSVFGGSGRFTIENGAGLATSEPGGIAGNLGAVTGAIDLSTSGNYVFNGTSAQATSTMMPATVNNLSINNAAGVTLSQPTTINGVLRLMAGVFNNTIPFTLGPSGSISFEGGSLLIPVSVESDESTIPQSFYVDQNFPNPFNPSTTLRFGLPENSFVTVKIFNMIGQEVATPFSGQLDMGVHSLLFDASQLTSGVYFYRVDAGKASEMKRMTLIK